VLTLSLGLNVKKEQPLMNILETVIR
jgi:hypothetical protein